MSLIDEHKQFKVLGVCGGIGAGKSSACKLLVSEFNCLAHIDADTVAHSVYTPGSQAIKDIVSEFGPKVLQPDSDEIDRKKLGSIVFADRAEMAKLENIVWPHVKTKLRDRIDDVRVEWNQNSHSDTVPIVVLEAAILLDAGWDDILDGIWVVTTPKSTALDRLMTTRGLSQEEAEKRITAQDSRRGIATLDEEVKTGVVTRVIENKGTLDDLKALLGSALKDPKSW
eukprot:CAMPEP_0117049536 /NCGR_PEP_ID=MMETSP0472-20121206/34199_1 /TAXON_ID=693140 ORGANISM="Tiarina fusus, Strain LIS" /NCGR_SAMPLE_ID=MMETSP0472 /ASSEMBLY_ACC=CAM_ASM_000603 /LENGTH=226 /DNA_ID=CAMNT_0004762969 /DNA_START=178 /DNA_END=855 /DNA_ORIENTATION=+